jgi:hypothetical protein
MASNRVLGKPRYKVAAEAPAALMAPAAIRRARLTHSLVVHRAARLLDEQPPYVFGNPIYSPDTRTIARLVIRCIQTELKFSPVGMWKMILEDALK